MDDLKQLIKENYQNLPDDLKQTIANPELRGKFRAIATANGLSEDQLEALKNETYFVLLGLENLSDYGGNIQKQLGISFGQASLISTDVYKNIFRPVETTLEAIEKAIEENEEGLTETSVKERENQKPQEKNYTPNLSAGLNERAERVARREPETYIPPQTAIKKPEPNDSLKRIREELSKVPEIKNDKAPVFNSAIKENPPINNTKRYGIEPAKDLGANDFDWKGNVGGVEIENQYEEEDDEENLDKSRILEEIEHPPAYGQKTAFERQITGESRQTDFRPKPRPSAPENLPTGNNDLPFAKSQEEIEKSRKERYHSTDPYREPLE